MAQENKITTISVIGLIIALLLIIGQNYFPQSAFNTEKIQVSGKSQILVDPDEGVIRFSIITKEDTAKQAQENNKKYSLEVIDALIKIGINKESIETYSYTINEYGEWSSKEDKYVTKGYRAVNMMQITVKDLDKLSVIVDSVMQNGANQIDTITYQLSKEKQKQVRNEALEKATIVATEKADIMAKNLGVSRGKVTSIVENNYYYTPFELNTVNVQRKEVNGAYDSLDAGGGYLGTQKVEVTSTVSLEFGIK